MTWDIERLEQGHSWKSRRAGTTCEQGPELRAGQQRMDGEGQTKSGEGEKKKRREAGRHRVKEEWTGLVTE